MSRFNLTNVSLLVIFLTASAPIPGLCQVDRSAQMEVREHVNRGNAFMARNNFSQALAEYNAALDIDPGSQVAKDNMVLVYNNWGIFYFRQHKFEEAKAQWETALKWNPYDHNAKQNMAVLKNAMAKLPPAKPPESAPNKEGDSATKSSPSKESEAATPSGASVLNKHAESKNETGDAVSPAVVLMNNPEAAEKAESQPSSGAVVIMGGNKSAANATESSTPPESAVAVTAPPPVEPPPQPATPKYNFNSPYAFPEQTAPVKPGAEVTSPYAVPTHFPAAVYKPAPAPAPVKPKPGEWVNPVGEAAKTTASANVSNQNMEERLGQIEEKVYGKKKTMPILKRVEKLEHDISGGNKSGTLEERIEALAKNCGL